MTKIIILDNASEAPPLFRGYYPGDKRLKGERVIYQMGKNHLLLMVPVEEKNDGGK